MLPRFFQTRHQVPIYRIRYSLIILYVHLFWVLLPTLNLARMDTIWCSTAGKYFEQNLPLPLPHEPFSQCLPFMLAYRQFKTQIQQINIVSLKELYRKSKVSSREIVHSLIHWSNSTSRSAFFQSRKPPLRTCTFL